MSFGHDRVEKEARKTMETEKNAEMKKEEREQVLELGSDMTRSSKGNIIR